MNFVVWYEEVEKKSYLNLSLQEKNALECKFFDYLRKADKDEVPDLSSQDKQNSPVTPRVAALSEVRGQAAATA